MARHRKKHFFVVYKTFLAELVDKHVLSFHEAGLALYLLRFLDWESNRLVHPKTHAPLSGTQIAKLLKSDPSTMHGYLNRLSGKGMLAIERSENGHQNFYVLNVNFAVQGRDVEAEQTEMFEDVQIRRGKNADKEISKRSPIPASMRYKVLYRDNFTCVYCGRSQQDGVQLHVDHVVPQSKGGETTAENLVTSCGDCNLGKHAMELDADKLPFKIGED